MKKFALLFWGIMCLLPVLSSAEMVAFKESYTYDAGEADSKLSCRAIALLEVKRLLLEKLGVYIESRTQVTGYEVTRDQIIACSAGIVKTQIIKEDWNGKTYSLTARIEADPKAVSEAVTRLKDDRATWDEFSQIESANEKSIEKIRELQEQLTGLQNNLIKANQDYSQASRILSAWDQFEAGLEFMRKQQFPHAVDSFSKAIAENPTYLHYYQRARSYNAMEQHRNAIADFNTAIELAPDLSNAYFLRGMSFRRIGEKSKGVEDIRKAARMGNGPAKRWLKMNNIGL